MNQTLVQFDHQTGENGRPFSSEELAGRLSRLHGLMDRDGLDALIVFSPENIYYLTGLNHFGFFSPHILVVPREGRLNLVTRTMESATIEAQLKNVVFHGHTDDETPGEKAVQVLKKMHLSSARLGIEKHSLFSPIQMWETLKNSFPDAAWSDGSYLIDRLRMIKSKTEINFIKEASRISTKMMQ
ncbi:MAG: aminopeptidase P family N-terminal domain-containing protein, partial [Desulfobacterales bacterium]|nr:aminopeptidase P family N-terminal domain-containing protein [Desulfobacterales bacterium]